MERSLTELLAFPMYSASLYISQLMVYYHQALDDVISEVVWEMVQDAAVRALLCITVVDLDQTVVQSEVRVLSLLLSTATSEVHHFLRDYRLLPTALRDVESVLDKAIEAFLESGRSSQYMMAMVMPSILRGCLYSS